MPEAIRPEAAGAEDPVFGLSGRQVGWRVGAAAGPGIAFSEHSGRVGLAGKFGPADAFTLEVATTGGWQSADTAICYMGK